MDALQKLTSRNRAIIDPLSLIISFLFFMSKHVSYFLLFILAFISVLFKTRYQSFCFTLIFTTSRFLQLFIIMISTEYSFSQFSFVQSDTKKSKPNQNKWKLENTWYQQWLLSCAHILLKDIYSCTSKWSKLYIIGLSVNIERQ